MVKKKISLTKFMFLILITTIIVTQLSLSRYETTSSGNSSAKVAKWENGLKLIDEEPIIFSNGEINSESVRFNVICNSEVASKCDIVFANVPMEIDIILENSTNKSSCFINDNNITVCFLLDGTEKEATFDMENINQVVSVSGCNITMISNNTDDGKYISFTNDINNLEIRLEIQRDNDNVTITFGNFNQFIAGSNEEIEHTVTIETLEQELPNISEIELYATFEQID